MKKVLSLIVFVFLFTSVNGQIGRYPFHMALPTVEEGDGNYLSNGTFDSATGWTPTNVTISGGTATFTGNGSVLVQTNANMNGSMTNSTGYKLEFDMTGAGFYFYFKSADGAGSYMPGYYEAVNGHNSYQFTTPSDWEQFWDGIRIECISGAGTYVMDNISITLQ